LIDGCRPKVIRSNSEELSISLTISEKTVGPDHPYVGAPLNNLANLYKMEGRYSEAERLYRRALQIQEKSLGPSHPMVAGDLNNLGNLYLTEGRYADSEASLERSLSIQDKTLGAGHPLVAGNLNNLGNLYAALGRFFRCGAVVQTKSGNSRKGFWSRPSRSCGIIKQSYSDKTSRLHPWHVATKRS